MSSEGGHQRDWRRPWPRPGPRFARTCSIAEQFHLAQSAALPRAHHRSRENRPGSSHLLCGPFGQGPMRRSRRRADAHARMVAGTLRETAQTKRRARVIRCSGAEIDANDLRTPLQSPSELRILAARQRLRSEDIEAEQFAGRDPPMPVRSMSRAISASTATLYEAETVYDGCCGQCGSRPRVQ